MKYLMVITASCLLLLTTDSVLAGHRRHRGGNGARYTARVYSGNNYSGKNCSGNLYAAYDCNGFGVYLSQSEVENFYLPSGRYYGSGIYPYPGYVQAR